MSILIEIAGPVASSKARIIIMLKPTADGFRFVKKLQEEKKLEIPTDELPEIHVGDDSADDAPTENPATDLPE